MRRKPYTKIGIKRLKCFRCGESATAQWQICSDGNTYRPICTKCDIELNTVVLKFMGFADWEEKIIRYTNKKSGGMN